MEFDFRYMDLAELYFKPIEAGDLSQIFGYFCRRPNKTCDSVVPDSFIWRDFAKVRFAVAEENAVLWLMGEEGKHLSAMPACSEDELRKYFEMSVCYFHEVLSEPFKIALADEDAVCRLGLFEDSRFLVREQADMKDYLYDAEALKTLSGKKLHKKKNRLNSFLKEYEGRFEYRRLTCADKSEVADFLDRWMDEKGEEAEIHLDYEVHGIRDLLDGCRELAGVGIKMAGVWVDGSLNAFTVGSLNPYENMAVIHIEKADASVKGLYQYINQQFLLREFPGIALVNREDDMGEPGLRQAKESYHPIGFARKYFISEV